MATMCAQCKKVRFESRVADVPAEVKGKAVVVRMKALVCPDCGYKTIAGSDMPEYMRLAADAYRSQNGLLTSDEIRRRRESMGMSQERFAAYLGVGVASVKRWELGQVQDRAMDRLIRLVTDLVEAERNVKTVLALGKATDMCYQTVNTFRDINNRSVWRDQNDSDESGSIGAYEQGNIPVC